MIIIIFQNINHIKKLFNATCDIYEYSDFFDDNSKITYSDLSIKYSNISCRVSYYKNISSISTLKNNNFNNKIKQNVKLIIQNDINVKPGSFIIVNQNGIKTKYKNSGQPIIYSAHQEIILEIYDNIA